mgnify:CR=1 FL=1
MILGVGVDVCSVERFDAMLRRRPGVLDRILRQAEQVRRDGGRRSVASLAARFAAKEALIKAFGGVPGWVWRDAEVRSDPRGRPGFRLHGNVAARAAALGVTSVGLSITHDAGLAMAFVVLESLEPGSSPASPIGQASVATSALDGWRPGAGDPDA